MDELTLEHGIGILLIIAACVVISFWLTKELPDD